MALAGQMHVPMLIWMSVRFRAKLGRYQACLAAGKDDPVSTDHLFSTVLGLLCVTTAVRDSGLGLAGLGLAGPCRTRAAG